jgi:hypothetical protein
VVITWKRYLYTDKQTKVIEKVWKRKYCCWETTWD